MKIVNVNYGDKIYHNLSQVETYSNILFIQLVAQCYCVQGGESWLMIIGMPVIHATDTD